MSRVDLPGVFIGAHAVAAGRITTRQLRELSFRRLTAGVYADPGIAHDHQLYCRGVALTLPSGAAIGGRSAAAWYGASHARVHDPVTVVRAPGVRWGGRRGTVVHRTDLSIDDVDEIEGVPVTTALRTAWDTAVLERTTDAVAAIDAMLRAGALTLHDLVALVEASAARWGVARVREVVELVDDRAESPPESWVRVLLCGAGLHPVPQCAVFDGDRFVGRVDLGFEEVRVAVEYEGYYHFDPEQAARDAARLAALEAAGWVVIRVYAHDLRDIDAVVQRIRRVLIERGATFSR